MRSGRRTFRLRRPRPSARRHLVALLLALGASLQGCVGVAVQVRDTDELDPADVARGLRAARAGSRGVAVDTPPRALQRDERVHAERVGERVTYTYRRDTSSACWHLVLIVPVPTPGCDDVDVYVVEGNELVAARSRRYPMLGVVCSPFVGAMPAESSPDGIEIRGPCVVMSRGEER